MDFFEKRCSAVGMSLRMFSDDFSTFFSRCKIYKYFGNTCANFPLAEATSAWPEVVHGGAGVGCGLGDYRPPEKGFGGKSVITGLH